MPVIGPQKGGLEQFVSEGLALSMEKNALETKLCTIVRHWTEEQRKKEREAAFELAFRYTSEEWIIAFQSLLLQKEKKQKILLLSDYSSRLGGIESYIQNTLEKLRFEGHECIDR